MLPTFDSPFYRVTAKALIFDTDQRLLMLKNHNGDWELPGGGWEHGESYEDCVGREIAEELGVGTVSVGNVLFMYRGRNHERGFMTLRIVAPVQLADQDFTVGEDMGDAAYISREIFLTLNLMAAEGDIAQYAHLIWPEIDHKG